MPRAFTWPSDKEASHRPTRAGQRHRQDGARVSDFAALLWPENGILGFSNRALDRALANALDVLIKPISGEAFGESATKRGTLYRVTATSRTCAMDQQGFPCQHRASYFAQMGKTPPDGGPTFDIQPGNYLDVRPGTMMIITRQGINVSATW